MKKKNKKLFKESRGIWGEQVPWSARLIEQNKLEFKEFRSNRTANGCYQFRGEFWECFHFRVDSGHISFGLKGKITQAPKTKNFFVFMPPFSFAAMNFKNATYSAQIVICRKPLKLEPKFQRPFIFVSSKSEIPQDSLQMTTFLEQALFYNYIDPVDKMHIITQRMKKMIDARYCEKVLLKDLCNQLKVTPSQVTRNFKFDTGLSPLEYLNKLRCYVAVLYLIQGYDVDTVARQHGYASSGGFNKAMKKYTGLSPKKVYGS